MQDRIDVCKKQLGVSNSIARWIMKRCPNFDIVGHVDYSAAQRFLSSDECKRRKEWDARAEEKERKEQEDQKTEEEKRKANQDVQNEQRMQQQERRKRATQLVTQLARTTVLFGKNQSLETFDCFEKVVRFQGLTPFDIQHPRCRHRYPAPESSGHAREVRSWMEATRERVNSARRKVDAIEREIRENGQKTAAQQSRFFSNAIQGFSGFARAIQSGMVLHANYFSIGNLGNLGNLDTINAANVTDTVDATNTTNTIDTANEIRATDTKRFIHKLADETHSARSAIEQDENTERDLKEKLDCALLEYEREIRESSGFTSRDVFELAHNKCMFCGKIGRGTPTEWKRHVHSLCSKVLKPKKPLCVTELDDEIIDTSDVGKDEDTAKYKSELRTWHSNSISDVSFDYNRVKLFLFVMSERIPSKEQMEQIKP
jgi:hypothetical protein